jgi:hypothetical protein
VFTRARHLSLSWAKWIQSTSPNPVSLRSILILSSHLRLGLPSGPRPFVTFRNVFLFYGGELLAPAQPPSWRATPFSAVRDCLFNIFAAALHIWRPSPPSATWGLAMPWWQGSHLHSLFVEIQLLLWNPNVHCCVQKGPSLDPILNHFNPVYILTPYLFGIRFKIIPLFSSTSHKWSPSFSFLFFLRISRRCAQKLKIYFMEEIMSYENLFRGCRHIYDNTIQQFTHLCNGAFFGSRACFWVTFTRCL